MVDEFSAGLFAAFDLRGAPLVREALLARDAVTWSPARLMGFITMHAALVENTPRDSSPRPEAN
jgi:hypothetical protein